VARLKPKADGSCRGRDCGEKGAGGMSKHTPGLWTVAAGNAGDLRVEAPGNTYWPDALAIANVPKVPSEDYECGLKEMGANARLIAAAPSMHETLEEALRWVDESQAAVCPVCGVSATKCGCWVGMARAAIAKVEGKP
jgi:hypothetical protein